MPNIIHFSEMNHCEDNSPVNRSMPWDELCFALAEHGKHIESKDGLSISPCTYSGKRRLANVEAMHMVILDLDHGIQDPLAWLDANVPYQYFAWSSWNDGVDNTKYSTSDGHRFRVMIPLDKPVPSELLKAFSAGIRQEFPDADAQVAANSNALYFTPRRKNPESGREPWTRKVSGMDYQVDIDALRHEMVEIAKVRAAQLKRQQRAAEESVGKINDKRIRGVLGAILRGMAEEAPGGRTKRVMTSAKQIVRLNAAYGFGCEGPIDMLRGIALASMGAHRQRDVERAIDMGRDYAASEGPEYLEERSVASMDETVVSGDAYREPVSGEDTIKAQFPKAPIDPRHTMPYGYVLGEGGQITKRVLKNAGTEKQQEIIIDVSLVPIFIARRLIDVDNQVRFVVCWRSVNGWKTALITREDIASSRKIVQLAAHGAPVTSSRARAMVDYFERYELENNHQIPTSRLVSCMGWHEEGFVIGNHVITPTSYDVQDLMTIMLDKEDGKLDKPIVDAYHLRGTFNGWLRAIQPLVKFDIVMAMLCSSLSAVLLDPTSTPGYAFDISWHTSTGKSSALDVAASAFGKPGMHGLVMDWQSTSTYLERMSSAMQSLPYFADDTKTCQDKTKIGEMLYSFVSRGKGRGTVKGVQQTARKLGVLISTGEQAAVKYTNDDGAAARTVTIQGLPFGEESEDTRILIESVLAGCRQHYGHAVVRLVQWIMGMEHHKIMQMSLDYRQDLGALARNGKGQRKAKSFALMAIVREWLEIEGINWPYESLKKVFLNCHEVDTPKDERAFQILRSWCLSNLADFRPSGKRTVDTSGPNNGWHGIVGYSGDNLKELLIKPEKAKDVLQRHDMWEENLPAIWSGKGLLVKVDGRREVRRSINGVKTKFLSLDLSDRTA